MQLLELRNRLRSQIGNPTTVDVTDQDLNQLLNDSMKDITGRFRFHKARKRCSFWTVNGQGRYGLPVDCESVLRLWDMTNRLKLEKIGDRQFSSQTNLADTVAKPEKYVRYRDYVELYPIPDQGTSAEAQDGYEIEVYYKYKQALLTDNSDVPGIPDSWHLGIVLYAKYLYRMNQDDIPKQQAALEVWKIWVQDKPTEIDEESVDIDSGVDVLTLSQRSSPRQDFNHAD